MVDENKVGNYLYVENGTVIDKSDLFIGICEQCHNVLKSCKKKEKIKIIYSARQTGLGAVLEGSEQVDDMAARMDCSDEDENPIFKKTNLSADFEIEDVQVINDIDSDDEDYFETRHPPAEAIANGLWIGELPEQFHGLTRTDELAISLMVPSVFLATVVGTTHHKVCSHFYVVQNKDPIIRHVPANTNESFRLTVVGAMTREEIAVQRTRFPLQVSLCQEVLAWYLENNLEYIKYKNYVDVNRIDFSDEGCFVDRTDSSANPVDKSVVDSMIFGTTTYNTGDGSETEASEHSEIRSRFIFEMPVIGDQKKSSIDLLARNSSNFVHAKNLANLPLFFPTLIPFGSGGPSQPRLVQISVEHWIRIVLLLGKRGSFQKHWGFLPVAFDFIAVKKAFTAQYIAMRMNTAAVKAGTVAKKSLQACVDFSNDLERRQRRGEKVHYMLII